MAKISLANLPACVEDSRLAMHDANPSWSPLYVVHPGGVARKVRRRE
jgi:hypothetical protein